MASCGQKEIINSQAVLGSKRTLRHLERFCRLFARETYVAADCAGEDVFVVRGKEERKKARCVVLGHVV